MKTKKIITIASTSALASGMARGAVVNSGVTNISYPCPATVALDTNLTIDVNGDGITDFTMAWGTYSGATKSTKPFLTAAGMATVNSTPGSAVLVTNSGDGLSMTPFGTQINSNYLSPDYTSAYFYENGGGSVEGTWNNSLNEEAYVGIELLDTNNDLYFGWMLIDVNAAASPKNYTIVSWAYETVSGLPITAGATNEVGVLPGPPTPYIPPLSQTNGAGGTVQFSILMLANPAPTFQWAKGPPGGHGPYTNLTDGGIISGSSTSNLTLAGVTAASAGDYEVIVSNSYGSVTFGPAALTIVSPQVAPASLVLFSGRTCVFNVSGASSTFQWQLNGQNLTNNSRISGATTSTLTISNLLATDAGNYTAILNFGSPVSSAIGSLTVMPATNLYEATVLSYNPVAYYTLNEVGNPATGNQIAYDNGGGFNGIYGPTVSNGFSGFAGPDPAGGFYGFSTNNWAALFTTTAITNSDNSVGENPADGSNSVITVAPWNITSSNATIVCWVNPTTLLQYEYAGVVWTGGGAIEYPYPYNGALGGYATSWNWSDENSLAYLLRNTGYIAPANEWSMLVLSVVPTNLTMYMFNSSSTNVYSLAPYNTGYGTAGWTWQPLDDTGPGYIGNESPSSGVAGFNGAIDEVATFSQALTANQAGALWSSALGVPPPPIVTLVGTNVEVTWLAGTLISATNALGPYTTNVSATSPYIIAPPNTVVYYEAVVNGVASAPAALPSPSVTPSLAVLYTGASVVFSVTNTYGTYQWQSNGVNLTDNGRMTGSSTFNLTILNLQPTDAASYGAILNYGSVDSSVASLTVLPESAKSIYAAAVLSYHPVVYYQLNDQGDPSTNNLIAYDHAGGFNGIYGLDVDNAFEGIQGPNPAGGFLGFPANEAACAFTPDDANSVIDLPSWNVAPSVPITNVTFTAWINSGTYSQTPLAGIINVGPSVTVGGGIDYYNAAGTKGYPDLGFLWNDGGNLYAYNWDSGVAPPPNQWAFVAFTVAGSNDVFYEIDSGQTNALALADPHNTALAVNQAGYIGDDGPSAGNLNNFEGMITEVAVYNQALSSSQIFSLYNAGVSGTPPPPSISLVGTNVQVAWQIGTLLSATNLLGPWTTNLSASSPLIVAPATSAVFYRVVVTAP